MSMKGKYGLHRYPQAHMRVWRIGREVLRRLEELGAGELTSRTILCALLDEGKVRGKANVKADAQVRRVLGRVFHGRESTEKEAVGIARSMYPRNP